MTKRVQLRPVLLATAVGVLSGCQPLNDELQLVLSDQVRQLTIESDTATDGPVSVIHADDVATPPTTTLAPVPPDTVAVPTQVESIKIAFVDSPSISAKDSVGRFKVLKTARIPGHGEIGTIVLHYNNALLASPFQKGQRVVFRFTASGEFFDIEGVLPY